MLTSIEANLAISAMFLLLFSLPHHLLGQTCTSSTQVTTNININAIVWVSDGVNGLTAANCAAIIAGIDTTTPANFNVSVANGVVITVSISNTIFIHGNFDIPSGATGDNSTLAIDGGGTPTYLHVTGDLGDNTNNNIQYDVVASTDHIIVDGTLYGKNNNQFIGNGTVSGGTLSVKNGTTCGSPCPVTGGFAHCTAGDAFCTTYTVLPILLSSFEAKVKDQSVNLKWTTDSEINFDHFILERSINGVQFAELAQIKGTGTNTTGKEYSYIDHHPFVGNSYYRLTSIDFDGYANAVDNNTVRVNLNVEKNFHVSPNPIMGRSLKGGINFDSSELYLVIYDQLGGVVGRYGISELAFELQLPNLSNGIYFAQLHSGDFTQFVRFAVSD